MHTSVSSHYSIIRLREIAPGSFFMVKIKRQFSVTVKLFALIAILTLYPMRVCSLEEAETAPGRSFSQAFIQGTSANLIIWAWDYFILQASYAQISPETWEKNLRRGFKWDNSDFFTNQILHPYQGGLYFNAARVHGYSFWESVPFTVYGSLFWEFFLERAQPSFNDLVTTTVGGTAFGESGYRLAAVLADSHATGRKKVLREIAALAVNPVYVVNKWIYGKPFVERNRLPRPRLELTVHSGLNRNRDDRGIFSESPHPFAGFFLNYGNPYDPRAEYGPYEYFTVQAGADLDYDNPNWDIYAHGVLYGRKLFLGDDVRGLVGLFQHFDYLENFIYKFASNGAGVGLQTLIPFTPERSLELILHAYGIVLGGVESRYSRRLTGRYYSLGPGAALKTGVKYTDTSLLNLSFFYYQYWFYTSSGSDSQNTVGILSAAAEVPVTDDLSLGAEIHMYDRWSDAGVDTARTEGFRVFLGYKL